MAAPLRPIGRPYEGNAGRMRLLTFNHRVVLGVAGVVASQDPAGDTMVVVSKVAATAGRYLVVPSAGRRFRQFRGGTVTVFGPTTAVYGANTTGLDYFWRSDQISTGLGVLLQFTQTSYADAEVPDNFSMIIDFAVRV